MLVVRISSSDQDSKSEKQVHIPYENHTSESISGIWPGHSFYMTGPIITTSTSSTHYFVLIKNVNRQEVGCLYCAKYYPSVTSLRYAQSEWHQRSSAIRKFPTCWHPWEGSENTRADITQQNWGDITDSSRESDLSDEAFSCLIFCKHKIKNAVFKHRKFFASCAYKENVPSPPNKQEQMPRNSPWVDVLQTDWIRQGRLF